MRDYSDRLLDDQVCHRDSDDMRGEAQASSLEYATGLARVKRQVSRPHTDHFFFIGLFFAGFSLVAPPRTMT
jgi:hypothetical protein